MKKMLVLIDNEIESLEIMKELIMGNEKSQGIETQIICKGKEESLDSIVDKVEDLIPKEESEQEKINIHIVIDTCLTDDEHEMAVIDENFSGINCLFNISEMLVGTKCQYKLSIMSRFFAHQLPTLEKLVKFKEENKNSFYAIVRKPFLESGKVDKGLSIMPQYVDFLPEKLLSKNNTISIINILTYILQGETK